MGASVAKRRVRACAVQCCCTGAAFKESESCLQETARSIFALMQRPRLQAWGCTGPRLCPNATAVTQLQYRSSTYAMCDRHIYTRRRCRVGASFFSFLPGPCSHGQEVPRQAQAGPHSACCVDQGNNCCGLATERPYGLTFGCASCDCKRNRRDLTGLIDCRGFEGAL